MHGESLEKMTHNIGELKGKCKDCVCHELPVTHPICKRCNEKNHLFVALHPTKNNEVGGNK